MNTFTNIFAASARVVRSDARVRVERDERDERS